MTPLARLYSAYWLVNAVGPSGLFMRQALAARITQIVEGSSA